MDSGFDTPYGFAVPEPDARHDVEGYPLYPRHEMFPEEKFEGVPATHHEDKSLHEHAFAEADFPSIGFEPLQHREPRHHYGMHSAHHHDK